MPNETVNALGLAPIAIKSAKFAAAAFLPIFDADDQLVLK